MNLEDKIKSVIEEKMADGTIEQLVAKKFEEGVAKTLESLFSSYGDVSKALEKEIKAVMIPFIEQYDYSEYVVKLDSVMTNVLKQATEENRNLLENFQQLMTPIETKNLELSKLFDIWKEYVEEHVSTDDLEIDYDDEPSYEMVEITLDVEEEGGRDWSTYRYVTIVFECDKDENMNFEFRAYKPKDKEKENWTLDYKETMDLDSIRYLNDFRISMMQFKQAGTKLVLDTWNESDEVRPKAEPEATFG